MNGAQLYENRIVRVEERAAAECYAETTDGYREKALLAAARRYVGSLRMLARGTRP